MLDAGAKPATVITAADLAQAGTRVPPFYAGDLLCPEGATPLYLGQLVALLLFESFDAFDRARLLLRRSSPLRFGAETGPVKQANYAALRFTRIAGPSPGAPDIYSPLMEGWVSPGFYEAGGRPIWQPLPASEGGRYKKGAEYGEQIRAEMAKDDAAMLVLDRDFRTQSVDPMFLEPEGGLGWYDPATKTLRLVIGVQSPLEASEALEHLLGQAAPAARPERIETHFAHMGGGFGGREHTPFPLYLRSRQCSCRAARYSWHMTASSSSRAASSGMPSRCVPGSQSTGRPGGCGPSLPITCWTVAGSPTTRRAWRRSP